MQFLFQPLTWGFFLVGVPILVHLINMLRHRKQSWAAMDFLMESYRKHRRWVLLKQWLLLASRILAMFLLVAMLARWISSSQSLGWFGGQVTHHFILLDDSYSMAEQDQGETAYGRGLKAVQSLIRSIATQPGEHQLTLLRWSRAELASRAGDDQARADVAADLLGQTVPRDASRLLDRIAASQPTALQLSAEPALDLITPLLTASAGEPAEIYFVTDLRRNEWAQPESFQSKLAPLVRGSTKVKFIDCAENSNANLALVSIEPEQETWAAGVPLLVKMQVRNYGSVVARNIVVKVRSLIYAEGSARPAFEKAYSGESFEAPPVVIEEIAPGETATRQVQLVFPVAGTHSVVASLPEDRLTVDNSRWCVIGIRQSQKILLIDGSADPNAAFFLKTALQPDGRQPTGMTVESHSPDYLRDATANELSAWDVIVLLETANLQSDWVQKLEEFVRSGGGLAFIAGPGMNANVINEQLYRGGQGFFPALIDTVTEVPPPGEGAEPQVMATGHPILDPLRNLSASPFQLIEIRQFLEADSKSISSGDVEVVAMGPDRKPLVLDKSYGEGHVIAVLTGLTGGWSTWAQDPTFVVFSLRTMGYLGSFRRAPTSESVGQSIVSTFNSTGLIPRAEVLLPAKGDSPRAKLEFQAEQSSADSPATVELKIDLAGNENDSVEGLLRPGLFELWMQTVNGEYLVQNKAHNVNGSEGNLVRVSNSELEAALQPIKISIQSASSLADAGWEPEAASHSTLLMFILIALLLGEQMLAYSASYHVPRIAKGGIAV